MRVSMPWFRPVATGLAILLALTCAGPLASAAERGASAAAPSSLAAQAAASVAKAKPTPRALMAQAGGATTTPSGSTDNRSFFSTPTGIAAVVLMIAGAGFVAVSIHRDNSKVHSPIR